MTQKIYDGDNGFIGVDTRRDPRLVSPGLASNAKNFTFTNAEAETRYGFQETLWARDYGFSFPFDFPLDFDDQIGLGTTYRAEVYADKYGNESLIVLGANSVYRITESGTFESLRYPKGEILDADATLIQVNNSMYLFRGNAKETLVWAGESFGDFVEPPVSAISIDFPKADIALYYQSRILAVRNQDEVLYTGIADTDTWLESQQFKVNLGTSDKITAIVPFGETSLVVFKDRSIYLLGNLIGDWSNATLDLLTSTQGCTSPRSIVQVGRDLWFFNERGLYPISLTIENKLQSNAQPISIDMEGIINQINWFYKDRFVAKYFDNKYVIAVTVTGNNKNNYILIYDFITQKWAGYHTAEFVDVKDFVIMQNQSISTLMWVSGTEFNTESERGVVVTAYKGFEDIYLGNRYDIDTELLTRGYHFETSERKQLRAVEIEQSTWHPAWSVSVKSDGIAEEANIAIAQTTDNRKYHTYNTPDYDLSNINGDHCNPYREDYSMRLNDQTIWYMQEGFDFDINFPLSFCGGGIAFDKHQRKQERRRAFKKGEYFQLRLRNNQGRLKIHSTQLEAHGRNVNQITKV